MHVRVFGELGCLVSPDSVPHLLAGPHDVVLHLDELLLPAVEHVTVVLTRV